MSSGTKVVTIPKVFNTYYNTKANLDALTGLKNGAIGFASDEGILYRQDGIGAANWVAITTISSPGEGHITLLCANYQSIGQGTWAIALSANNFLTHMFQNSSETDGDNFTLKVYLAKGTYTLRSVCFKGTNRSIFAIDIDTVEKGTIDTYAGSSLYAQVDDITNIVIASSGLKDLRVRVKGKHGSSTSYMLGINLLTMWRTG